MKLRTLVAGLAFIGASAGAFAVPTWTITPTVGAVQNGSGFNLGTALSPSTFNIINSATGAFTDTYSFMVTPTSAATDVLFANFLFTSPLQGLASSTSLTLIDTTTNTNYGSVTIDEPAFTAAELFFSGHTYNLIVNGTLAQGASIGAYAIAGTLTPVPEPETYALMGLGLVALVAARARRRKMGDSARLDTTEAAA
ncbi:hypothetical protein HNQ50_001517 [Silvimonas terrae]|uniref:Ice-binding protein C-terminal domain-containing protein n=1 Tax=Silvimonas terrae TaxID=300266 RepID=A0A840RDY0_9NEIS|nr:FxDxF family PEP-CTERM protein [Silvimonas terrae]MBB5190794.1 hypothetical protein [Silvimonas terrae]